LPRADKFSRFEQAILPHLDAAYNLARWLTRDENEAAVRRSPGALNFALLLTLQSFLLLAGVLFLLLRCQTRRWIKRAAWRLTGAPERGREIACRIRLH
jgi:hypothetical protein